MTADRLHPNCVAVNAVLEAAGALGRVQLFTEPATTAAAAAALLGVEVGAIANSLIFRTAHGLPLLVMTSGAHRVDTVKAATAAGAGSLGRADAEFVHRVTGQRIGGVAPVGHPQPIHTLVDVALAEHAQIWAAGGVPHAVFPTTFTELVALTAGTAAEIA